MIRARLAPILNVARRADRSTLGAMTAGFWVQAALVATGVLSARILGVEDRGHLALLWLIPLAIAAIGNLGLPLALIFYTARDPACTRPAVRSLAPIAAVQTLILIGVQGLVLALYLPGEPDNVVDSGLLTIPWAASILFQLYGLALFQGQSRFLEFNLTRIIPMTLYAVACIVLFLVDEGSLFTLTLAAVAANVVAAVVTLALALRTLPANPENVPAPERRELFRFGAKAMLGSFSLVETLQVDQTFVGFVLAPAALGLYVVATSFTNLARFTVTNVGMVAYPRIASLKQPNAARNRIWRYFTATVIGCVFLAGVLEAAVGWVVPSVFGDEFDSAVPIARILILGTIFLCARRILSDGVRGAGHPGLGTIAEIASWAWLVPALIVFTELWEVEGAAWAAASSYVFSLSLLLFLVFRREDIRPAWVSSLLGHRGVSDRTPPEWSPAPESALADSPHAELVPDAPEDGAERV